MAAHAKTRCSVRSDIYLSPCRVTLGVGVTKWWRNIGCLQGQRLSTPPADTYHSPLPEDSHLSVGRKSIKWIRRLLTKPLVVDGVV